MSCTSPALQEKKAPVLRDHDDGDSLGIENSSHRTKRNTNDTNRPARKSNPRREDSVGVLLHITPRGGNFQILFANTNSGRFR